MSIRVGVIGVGIIGKKHLNDYKNTPNVEIVAIADINEQALKEAQKMFNVPHAYKDFRELLKRDDIDTVDVCVHNNLHAPIAIEALKAGKHVYVEKPIASTYADAKAMIDTAKEYKRMLHVQMDPVFSVETRLGKSLIDEGRLGEIYFARATFHRWRGRPYVDGYATPPFVQKYWAGGGAMLDVGVYPISQILYLLNMPKIERIKGKVYQKIPMNEQRKKESNYDVEEFATGIVQFENDLNMDFAIAWAANIDSFEGSYILGSLGGIRLNPFGFFTVMGDANASVSFDLKNFDYRRHQLYPNEEGYDSSFHHWIYALEGKVNLLPTAEIALQHIIIAEGTYLSSRLRREVTVEEVISNSKPMAIKV
ncbi:MAG: Gfo/Idh/MocA family oxidoreductase [Sulfolobaceae archaeon]|nr:Gfo/Idh/MocA family oxidoreductase [Sulfolobaceae archaeon]QFQ13829.1 beta-N-acetylglucosaminidase [uncultured archaeon]